MGEPISLDDYTTLPGKSGATHSISLCIAGHHAPLALQDYSPPTARVLALRSISASASSDVNLKLK